jgi:hypothetical protein
MRSGNSEVSNLYDRIILPQKDIVRFEIPMDNVELVDMFQALGDVDEYFHYPLLINALLTSQPCSEILTAKFHLNAKNIECLLSPRNAVLVIGTSSLLEYINTIFEF